MRNHLNSSSLSIDSEPEPIMGDPARLFQLLQTTRSIGTWRIDVASGSVFWSPTVFDIHGLPRKKGPVNLEAAIRVYHPQDAKTVAWLVMEAIEKKCGFTFLLRLIRGDGKVRLVQSVATVDCDETGKVTQIFGFFKDVTERCSAQDISEGRNQLVRSIIRNAPTPIAVLDRKMCYLDVSPSWRSQFGLSSQAKLAGRGYYDLLPMTDAMRNEHERALAGETIGRDYVPLSDKYRSQATERIVIFPWHGSGGEIGGIMIMLAKASEQNDREQTLYELANLMSQKSG